jgi:hypothetical protein
MSDEPEITIEELAEFIITDEVSIFVDKDRKELSVARSQDDEIDPETVYDETGWYLEALNKFSIEKMVSKEDLIKFAELVGLSIHEDPTPV